jgi:hypothetical protein
VDLPRGCPGEGGGELFMGRRYATVMRWSDVVVPSQRASGGVKQDMEVWCSYGRTNNASSGDYIIKRGLLK